MSSEAVEVLKRNLDIMFTGVTVQRRMLIPPKHQILPLYV